MLIIKHKTNKDKIINTKKQPYFIKDNQSIINGLIHHSEKEGNINEFSSKKKAYKKAVKELRKENDRESAYIFSNNGDLLGVYRSRTSDGLNIDIPDNVNLKDSILIHNHPSTKGETGIKSFGNSLSSKDILTAIGNNLNEITAVTEFRKYSIKRPQTGWNVFAEDIRNEYSTIFNKYRRILETSLHNKDFSVIIQHLTIKELSKKYGWKYTYSKF